MLSGKKFLWSLGILVFLTLGFWIFSKSRGPQSETTYSPTEVTRRNLELSVVSTGTVQSQNRLEIKPPIAGRIEAILVREGQTVKKGAILGWLSSTERVALLDGARARGQEEVERWKKLYQPTPLIAPLTGVLIARQAEPGQTVTASDIVLVMSDRLIVKANVDETDIAQLEEGQAARIVLDAYPKESIQAKIDHVAFDAKTVNNVTTYEVDVLPEKVPKFMKSGMTASVRVTVGVKKEVPAVPSEAVQYAERGSYAWVRNPNGSSKPAERDVQLGATDGKHVEIVSGLEVGETVLVPVLKFGTGGPKNTSPFMPMGRGARGGGGGRGGGSRK